MNEIYEYIEIPYDQEKSFIDQLNEQGKKGYEFCVQAQKMERGSIDFKTGQPKITLTLIFKHKKILVHGKA